MVQIVIKGILLGLYLAIAVGPIVFTVLKISMKYGHREGYAFVAGVSFSDIMFVILGNIAAQFMQGVLVYKTQIAIGGAALLLAMGGYTLFFKKDPEPTPDDKVREFDSGQLFKMFTQGFLMNTINPGPIFIWFTACTASATLSLTERVIMFGVTLAIVLSADILKVKLATRIREKLTPKTLHIINQVTAFILMGFGIAILIGVGIQYYEKMHPHAVR